MVAAFIGSEDEVKRIYEHAIKQKYRFLQLRRRKC